jgi:hypothetical protein
VDCPSSTNKTGAFFPKRFKQNPSGLGDTEFSMGEILYYNAGVFFKVYPLMVDFMVSFVSSILRTLAVRQEIREFQEELTMKTSY